MTGKYFLNSKLFRQKARKVGLTPICLELYADLDTPVSIVLKFARSPPTFFWKAWNAEKTSGATYYMGINLNPGDPNKINKRRKNGNDQVYFI